MLPPFARSVIRVASWLVPTAEREVWRREQEGELWFRELHATRRGKSDAAIRWGLLLSSLASFRSALAQRFPPELMAESARSVLRSPWLVVGVLAGMLALIVAGSGGLPHTKRQLLGPNFRDNDRLALIVLTTRTNRVGLRYGPAPEQIDRWRSENKSFEDVASFNIAQSWTTANGVREDGPFSHALVSPNWFKIAGIAPPAEMLSSPGAILLTHRFARDHLDPSRSPLGQVLEIDGKRKRVAGVLPRDFWFMWDELAAISVYPQDLRLERVVGFARLRPGVTVDQAENDLARLPSRERVFVLGLTERTRTPLRNQGLFTLLLFSGFVIYTAVRFWRLPKERRYQGFFLLKVSLGLAVILLFTFEYTATNMIWSTGSTRLERLLPAFLLWLFSTALFLFWAVKDQPVRCRRCLRRLELPTRVGALGRVLFDHEGTELICPKGHGTLYVEPSTETFRQSGRWTELDESWLDLFAGK